MKESTKDRVEGKSREVEGAVKETAGAVVRDRDLEAKGKGWKSSRSGRPARKGDREVSNIRTSGMGTQPTVGGFLLWQLNRVFSRSPRLQRPIRSRSGC
jgi:hypothetical protein